MRRVGEERKCLLCVVIVNVEVDGRAWPRVPSCEREAHQNRLVTTLSSDSEREGAGPQTSPSWLSPP